MARDQRITTGERQAIAEDVARRIRMDAETGPTPSPIVPTESGERMHAMILEHKLECREDGPIADLRRDVADLKSTVRGGQMALKLVGAAVALLQLVTLWSSLARPSPVPSAHAQTAHYQPRDAR
jgi:hypothetical protein